MSVESIIEDMQGYLYNDGMADYIQLNEGLGIVGQIASMIVGVLVTLIIVGLPIVIAIEVLYINSPWVQSGYDRLADKYNKGKVGRVLGLTIRDAKRALEESHTEQYGTSANWIYLKIKCKSVFLAVFIVAMVLGPGQFIIKICWNFIRDLVSVAFNLLS